MADLFQVEFATDDPAPVTSPYPGEVGSLTIIDTTNTLAVSGGEVVPSSQGIGAHDPSIRDATGVARSRGRMWRIRFRLVQFASPITAAPLVGASSTLAGTPNNNQVIGLIGGVASSPPVWQATQASGQIITTLEPVATNTWYVLHVMVRDAGFLLWINGNLVHVNHSEANATLHALLSSRAISRTNIGASSFRVYDPGGAYSASDWSLTDLNDTTVVSGESHSPGADGVFVFSFTHGTAVANDKISMRFRVQDASNYIEAYALRNAGNTSWEYRLDKVVAGVSTQLITPVTGQTASPTLLQVTAAGSTYVMSTMQSGSSNLFGRGSATDAALNTATGCQAEFGAATTASRLAHFPRSGYAGIDGGISVALFDSYFRRKRGGS